MSCSKCEQLKTQLATLMNKEAGDNSASEQVLEELEKLKKAVKKAKAERATARKNSTLAKKRAQEYIIELYRWRGIINRLEEHVDEQGKEILNELIETYAAFMLPLPEEQGKCPCPCHSSCDTVASGEQTKQDLSETH